MKIQALLLIAVCTLVCGCTGTPPTLGWSVLWKDAGGASHFSTVTAGPPSTATVDPSLYFMVMLTATSSSGISSMTISGTGNVYCEARVSATDNTGSLGMSFPSLSLGSHTETVAPPASPHIVLLEFNKMDPVQDEGVIRCGGNTPTNVHGVERYYDAWTGTLTFFGTASNSAAPGGVTSDLVITLKPPAL